MSISEKDIKKLWGLAGGLCGFPGCRGDCLVFVDKEAPTVVGDMAHVIAQSTKGPRGSSVPGADAYENLILLCPTHHKLVDKAPNGAFTESMLLDWKAKHEEWVRSRLRAPTFNTRGQLANALLRKVQESHAVWRMYGPESDIAIADPVSNVAGLWTLRKLSTIIPNNRWIINALRDHADKLTADEYAQATLFIEHAEGFEASAYDRRDAVPRFPTQFEEMIRRVAAE
jgi:hypothetical protein